MSYASCIKNISRAIVQGGELAEQEACDLFGAMLDAGVPDLELGALLVALHIKGESLNELLGFSRALDQRTFRLRAPCGAVRPVIFPCCGGAGERADLLPLLALLVRRFGVPVLIHGELNSSTRVPAAYVLRELGVMPCPSAVAAQEALDAGNMAYVPTAVLAPGLAALLSLRERLGVYSSADLVAKLLQPFGEEGVRVVCTPRAACAEQVSALLLVTGARALLAHSGEAESAPDAARRPRLEYFDAGGSQVLFEAEIGRAGKGSALARGASAATAANWVKEALAGRVPIPLATVNQLACCLFASGYAADLNQAKAIVAIKTAWPVAA